jgi:CRP/FNR family transcriptional regulator
LEALTKEVLLKHLQGIKDPKLIEEMLQYGRVRHFKANDIIIDIGMPVTMVPVLIKGVMRVVRHDDDEKELLLYYLVEGESCAASMQCCMTGKKSEVQAIAEEDSTLLFLPHSLADSWMMKYADWKNFIISTFQARFNDLLNALDALAFNKLDERLAHYLQEKSRIHKSDVVHISHQEIATDLNSSREVISRLLKKMEQRGMLVLGRNSIRLMDL